MEVFIQHGKIKITGIEDMQGTQGKPDIPSIPSIPGIPKIENKPIIIPSQLYPLSGTPEIFHAGNTEVCTNQELQQIFDSTEAYLGFCYSNIENLALNLKKAGISKEHYKTYIGWLFIGNQIPVHHAFLVFDGKYLLDFSTSKIYEQLDQESLDKLSIEELRNKLAEEFIKEQSKPHSQRATFGKAIQSFLYIASPCKPSQGRLQYNKLIKAYPKHPCIRGTKASGITDMQQRIYKKNISKD